MRKEGQTLREIGRSLGISAEQARQIIAKEERSSRLIPVSAGLSPSVKLSDLQLSVRSANALRILGLETVGDLRNTYPIDERSYLLCVPNFWKVSFAEIEPLWH